MSSVKTYYLKKGSVEYALNGFAWNGNGNNGVDTWQCSMSRTYADTIIIGDEVSIGYHNELDVFVEQFAGDIVLTSTNEQHKFTMESFGGRLNRSELIDYIFTDESPEDIVEYVTTNYTDLTYSGTATSGAIISRFVVNGETAGQVINRILKELDWQVRVTNSKEVFFEPKGDLNSSMSLTVGTNAFMLKEWATTPNQLINDVTIVGDNAVFNTDESFVATAGQTNFTVLYKIVGTVRVTVNGTEVVGGQEGSVGTYAYSVDKEEKKIVFETGLSASDAVIIYYNYEVPIKIKAKNQTSISLNGRFPKKLSDNNLKTMSAARAFAKKILKTYSEPIKTGTLLVNWNADVNVGETIQVTDSYNNIDKEFVIVGITMKYPDGTKNVKVGVEQMDLVNWNKGIDQRIKNLENKQDNSDIVQRFEGFSENVNVVTKKGRTRIRSLSLGHSWIVGSSTNGIVGTNLGTQDGLQQVVGSAGRIETILRVLNYTDKFIERFNFDTYVDDTSTGTVNLANNTYSFTTGQVLLSKVCYKNETNVVNAKFDCSFVTGSSGDVTVQLCSDGTNWETVTIGNQHAFVNVGQELKYKVTSSDTVVISEVNIEYNK